MHLLSLSRRDSALRPRTLWQTVSLLALAVACAAGFAQEATAPHARNIILFIGDGCGFNHLVAAGLYQYGELGRHAQDRFPIQFAVSTFSADGEGYNPSRAWTDFGYVMQGATDSAAAATALATGIKTRNGAIGVGPEGERLETILERAEALGKATGVVTSVPVSHATPAGFVAHIGSRGEYAEIARQMLLSSAADVIMGAGHPLYDNSGQPRTPSDMARACQYVGGEEVWRAILEGKAGGDADGDGRPDPWRLVETLDQFQALMEGPTPPRVLGLARVAETLQQRRPCTVDANHDGAIDAQDLKLSPPDAVPRNPGLPDLTTMTRGALNVLDDDPDGFFLMVEGGAIDWAAHDNAAGRMIEEVRDFTDAIAAAVAWVEAHSNWRDTLLIVTADHETGYLMGPNSDPTWEPLVNNGAGNMPGLEWHSTGHTNMLVGLSAIGEAAVRLEAYADQFDPCYGRYVDNTEIAKVMFEALR